MVYGLGTDGKITHLVYDEEAYNLMKKDFNFYVELPDYFDLSKHDYIDGEVVVLPRYTEWESKQLKIHNIKNLKVTVKSGRTFDGDETSQDRMARAVNIASISGQTETQWKLADNTIVTVTLDELKEALSLAGKRMSEMWLNQ